MDDKKDVQQKDSRPHFFDNRTLRIEPFGANISASRAYGRAERIAAAIYLVTNHVPDSEAAKTVARRASFDLLSAILLLKEEMRSSNSQALKNSLDVLRTLISTIRLLAVSGRISAQNAETLIEALDETGNFLVSSQKTPLSESLQIRKEDLFEIDDRLFSKGQEQEVKYSAVRTVPIKDRMRRTSAPHLNGDGKRARTDRILGMLAAQGQLGIKDIAATLSDYSEKMIQRELKQLVVEGRVKKMGSKRWSTYALA